jgi:hypothetical protein
MLSLLYYIVSHLDVYYFMSRQLHVWTFIGIQSIYLISKKQLSDD